MGLLKAIVKTVSVKANQTLYNRDKKNAQSKAYATACKKAHGKFDPNWKNNYQKALSNNKQKAKENKELRTTFIDSFFN